MARQLLEAILDNGVSNPNYFDGRLLTASALRADQDAQRARQRRLGRAIGRGVVEGLWVTIEFAGTASAPPLLGVREGLAINRNGQTLRLPAREVVALAPVTTPPPAGAGLFKTCEPPTSTVDAPAEGFYVLVLSPASAFSGRAPISGLAEPAAGAGCGSDSAIEGVRLRSVALDPLAVTGVSDATRQQIASLLTATSNADVSKLRNIVAHLCLGTEMLATFATDPFARETTDDGGTEPALADYGALDALVDSGSLTDCDVPLAVYCWRQDTLLFVDNWAARRRVSAPASSATWPTLSGGRRRAEAEAVLFQFQEQLAAIALSATTPSSVRAGDYFRWLPPAGLLPIGGGASGKAFDTLTFVQGIVCRNTVFLEGARVSPLLDASLAYPPFDLSDPTMLWLYGTRENSQAISGGPTVPQAFVIFASGQMPFYGASRFDVSRLDFTNFSDGLDEGVFA